jgi:Cd2+/Zn2+-exporting ATPase
VFVGNARWLQELGLFQTTGTHDNRLHAAAERLAATGKTPLLVALGAGTGDEPPYVIGIIAVADKARPGVAEVVATLRRRGVEQIAVLTGDNQATAQALAEKAGANEVFAELLPGHKADVIRRLRERYGPVAMVGDGINDAPALATADVGIAMGGVGTDVALEAADIVLMRDDLDALARTISLSRRTVNTIRQNITVAFVIKVLALVFAALGFVNLWIAVVADVGASLAVTLNGLRLARGGRGND